MTNSKTDDPAWFDDVVAAIERGATIKQALQQITAAPSSLVAFNKHVRLSEAMACRLDAALAARGALPGRRTNRRHHHATPAEYEEALHKIATHEIENLETMQRPSRGAIENRARHDPEFRARLSQALSTRRRFRRDHYTSQRRSEEDFEKTLSAYRNDTRAISEIATPVGYGTIYHRIQRDANFRRRFEQATQKRSLIDRHQIELSDHLRRLRHNELYDRTNAIVRQGDDVDADDLRSEAILAMLEGRQFTRKDLWARHYRGGGSARFRSLDEKFSRNENDARTYVDMLTTSDMVAF